LSSVASITSIGMVRPSVLDQSFPRVISGSEDLRCSLRRVSQRFDPASAVTEWLFEQTLEDLDLPSLVAGCCERLWAAGVPMWRFNASLPTLHPLYVATSMRWVRGAPTVLLTHAHGDIDRPGWQTSPFKYVVDQRVPFLRRRLEGEHARVDFPILREIRDQGATDYALFRVPFSGADVVRTGADGLIASFATDAAGGFSDDDLHTLQEVHRALAVACKMGISRGITENVLAAYLGPDAGRRVLAGSIRRGDCTSIQAAIWYSDLRRSTPLAAALPPTEFLAALNSYFESTAGSVLAHGGEVLRFVGDAVLAIFPIEKGGASVGEACDRAVRSVRAASARMADLNAARTSSGAPTLSYGVGLHVGEVLFGNIGIPERLEFSVIGPAANEVARLESLTKTLGAPALFSGEFARHVELPWRPMGRHALRGVDHEIEIFALPD
jgi:adenylate cyclase